MNSEFRSSAFISKQALRHATDAKIISVLFWAGAVYQLAADKLSWSFCHLTIVICYSPSLYSVKYIYKNNH